MPNNRITRAVAIHEAAHAVARVCVGDVATPVEARQDGTGESFPSGAQWKNGEGGQYAAWDYLQVQLAGGLAEARVSKKAAALIFLCGGASADFLNAKAVFSWLVNHGYADDFDACWERAEAETKQFVRAQWPAIERVATLLQERGRLEAFEVLAAIGQAATEGP